MPVNPHWHRLSVTAPGRGAAIDNDGDSANVKTKSIPNVSTHRLRLALAAIHDTIHTTDGLHAFSESKRALVEQGVKARLIAHELLLRGDTPTDCTFCFR